MVLAEETINTDVEHCIQGVIQEQSVSPVIKYTFQERQEGS